MRWMRNKVSREEEGNVKETSTGSEVNLGLESKDGEGKGDPSSDAHLIAMGIVDVIPTLIFIIHIDDGDCQGG